MQMQPAVFPVIAISGLPRVGSMWTFNVARSLVRASGLELVPDQIYRDDNDAFAAADAYLKSGMTGSRCIIKVHTPVNISPNVKVIRNTRNLKDRLFSFCRFMDLEFDDLSIRNAVTKSMEFDAFFDQWPAEQILNIPFESIETHSIELIRRIAEFTGLPNIEMENLEAVDYQFSKQQVKKRIAEIEERVFDQTGKVMNGADPDAILEMKTGQVRAFDVASGFQSGHVSDYRPGDWEHLWTDRQKQMVDDAIRIVTGKSKKKPDF